MLVSTLVKLLTSSLANFIDHNKSINIVALKYFNFILFFGGLAWLSVASYWFLVEGLSINCLAAMFSCFLFLLAIMISIIYSKHLSNAKSNNDNMIALINEASKIINLFKNKLLYSKNFQKNLYFSISTLAFSFIAYKLFINKSKIFFN